MGGGGGQGQTSTRRAELVKKARQTKDTRVKLTVISRKMVDDDERGVVELYPPLR